MITARQALEFTKNAYVEQADNLLNNINDYIIHKAKHGETETVYVSDLFKNDTIKNFVVNTLESHGYHVSTDELEAFVCGVLDNEPAIVINWDLLQKS